MCTTGAKVFVPGREFVLFKNRDFKRGHFDDVISITERSFGVLGLETWDGLDPANDRFSGFSIGSNMGLACCDSNVKTIENGVNYDRLVQAVVDNCSTVDEAVQKVQTLVASDSYCWANLIVATPDEVAAIEVRDGKIGIERSAIAVARANHHICLGANPDDDDTVTTAIRYKLALDGLNNAKQLTDFFELLRTHALGHNYGICNHGLYETVYSYVLHWRDGRVMFYVYQGHPCEGGDYHAVPLNFGQPSDFSDYPSNRVP